MSEQAEAITRDVTGVFTDEAGKEIGYFQGKVFDDGLVLDGHGVGKYTPPEGTQHVMFIVDGTEPAAVKNAHMRRGIITFTAWRFQR